VLLHKWRFLVDIWLFVFFESHMFLWYKYLWPVCSDLLPISDHGSAGFHVVHCSNVVTCPKLLSITFDWLSHPLFCWHSGLNCLILGLLGLPLCQYQNPSPADVIFFLHLLYRNTLSYFWRLLSFTLTMPLACAFFNYWYRIFEGFTLFSFICNAWCITSIEGHSVLSTM